MTGTIQNAAVQVITDLRHDALQLGFTNDHGSAITKGDEVTLKADGTIKLRVLGSEIPLGIVVVGADDGKRVTVRTYFTSVIVGVAKGGTINAGVLVKPNGLKTNEYPQYVLGTSSDYSVAIVMTGAIVDDELVIGIIDGIVAGNDHAYAQQELAAYAEDSESDAYAEIDEKYAYLQNIAVAAANDAMDQEDISAGTTFDGANIVQPDVPRNVKVTITDGDISISAGIITVSGLNQSGVAITEEFDVTDGLVQEGDKVFAKITSIAGAGFAGNGAADTVDVGYQNKIGLPNAAKGSLGIVKLVANGTEQATAVTVDTVNGSFTPSTAPDGTNDYEVWYKIDSASLANLNALRTAYENLRAYIENIAAKLVTSTILTTP